jgi:putative hydrolase of the HAD superfamily
MIKNLVFDVGEVLLGYRWKDMLMNYGMTEEQAVFFANMMFTDPLWEELDLACRTLEETIRQYVRKYPDYEKEITWFMTHGEYMHVPRKDVWRKVHDLKNKGYAIYILSNYSEELFRIHTDGADFIPDADGIVVSYQIHRKKPEEAIYRFLLEKYRLIPEECIFFDDREENTEAARRIGMEAVTVYSKEQLLNELGEIAKRCSDGKVG